MATINTMVQLSPAELVQHLTTALASQERSTRAAEQKFGPLVINEMNERTTRLQGAIQALKASAAVEQTRK